MLMKNKKGFTLIELLTIIAILGILVLLAMPKFMGYVEHAKLAQIKNDTKVHEDFIDAKRVTDGDFHKEWVEINPITIAEQIMFGKLYNKKGLLEMKDLYELSEHTLFYEIPKKTVNTKLKGKFIYSEDGTVYYGDGKSALDSDETYKNYRWVNYLTLTKNDSPFMFTIADMSYDYNNGIGNSPIGNPNYGYWHYIGNEEIVTIPHVIQGFPVTSYNNMFAEHWDYEPDTIPKKIISTNKKIKNMDSMFHGFGYEDLNYENNMDLLEKSLDLTELDTSGVVSMNNMFDDADLFFLDVSSFDTSNVESMDSMFAGSKAELVKLDLVKDFISLNEEEITEEDMREMYYLNFDTRKVENMSSMFQSMHVEKIHVQSFDTSNVYTMDSMFRSATIYDGDSFKHFDISNVYNMGKMFSSAEILDTKLDLSTWETSNADDMDSMFAYISSGSLLGPDGYYNVRLENLYLNKFNMNSAYIGYLLDNAKVDNVYINDQNTIEYIKNARDGKPDSQIIFHSSN